MYFSSSLLREAYAKYRKNKIKNEGYNTWDSGSAGVSAAFDTAFLVIALVFFALEILVLFFAINIAIKCTHGGAERIVHIVLATVFTLPYMLLSVLFNKCAINTLKGFGGSNFHSGVINQID